MGGFDFEFEGKTYDILTEGGCPFFKSVEEEEAFNKWRRTPEGLRFCGPVPPDWSEFHYIEDRYPKNFAHRHDGWGADVGDDDASEEEGSIDWCSYEKCRYGCRRYFLYGRGEYGCIICGVISCANCARDSPGRRCGGEGCRQWICGDHRNKRCPDCAKNRKRNKK